MLLLKTLLRNNTGMRPTKIIKSAGTDAFPINSS
jgi:hypothetical protein